MSNRESLIDEALGIQCRGVGKRLGGEFVLTDINLEIRRGEIVVLIGPSGSGKSTFLRCLNLLHLIDTGDLHFFGKPIITAGNHVPLNGFRRGAPSTFLHVLPEQHRRDVGMVFQEFNLWEDRTVLANVVEGPIYALALERGEAIARARSLLEQFGLASIAQRRPGELSGGQRQRVAIARALAMQPKVLLLDEVTSALDPELVGDVLGMIRQLAQRGLTMVVVTHYLEFASQIADTVVMLDRGRIVESGSAAKVLTMSSEQRTREFIGRIESAR